MSDVLVRRAEPRDDDAVLDLLVSVMGRDPSAPNREFYRWKHELNPFGRSPAWVAEADGRVVAFRTFMRWEFRSGGEVRSAVRAVDTVTHPDHRGKGLFRTLTLAAVGELAAEGTDLVFNTPNDASRPGYLTMGWQPVGRLPARVVPGSPRHWRRLGRARAAADIWSQPTPVGQPVDEVDLGRLAADTVPAGPGLCTPRTEEFLRWRYGFEPLHYRLQLLAAGTAAVVFRLRRRGPAVELALLDVLGQGRAVTSRRIRSLVAATGADYALWVGTAGRARGLPLTSLGPLLTTRRLASEPPSALAGWNLSLGDVELF